MWPSLGPEQVDRFYTYLVFESITNLGLYTPAPKIWALQMGLKTQNNSFLENGYNSFE
jgi:hypothetical protein